ncbi:MAG TPA: hypothetical protein VK506_00535, partial [Conexibacter sp.]|nr:hypothetical protein [Conexibacter sp.]
MVGRGGLIAAVLVALAGTWAGTARGAEPVRLTAGFGPAARLGAPSALRLGLHVDPRRKPSPVTEVRLL